ncbi:MAG: hypothetical protein V1874_04645 [Spirochaetota bacterium]
MNKQKTIGIIFIIIGICISLAGAPFLTGYSKDRSLLDNALDISVRIRNKTAEPGIPADKNKVQEKRSFNFMNIVPETIPYRLFLALSVILIFMGIRRIDPDLRHKDKKENLDNKENNQ